MDHKNIFEIAFNAKNGKYGDEDLLTDLFAWYLRQDREIALQFVRMLTGITPSDIRTIETQPSFPEFPHDFPDMVIKTPEVVLVCEHKVASPLGCEQLERYLKIVVSERQKGSVPHALVFIARDLLMISPEVHNHPCYCRAPAAVHFRWKDVYRLVQENLSPGHPQNDHRLQFLDCLRYLKLAFLDPTGNFNLLFSKEDDQQEQRQLQEKSFGEAWKTIDGTVAWFEGRGFRPDYGSRKELYLYPRENAEVSDDLGLQHLHVTPNDGKNLPKEAGFQPPCLRFSVHFGKECPELIARMVGKTPACLETLDLPVAVKPDNPAIGHLRFWLPLAPILEAPSLSDSLRDVVTELYRKAVLPAFVEEQYSA